MKKSSDVRTVKFRWPNKKRHLEIPLYGGAFYFCTDREEYAQVADYLTTHENSIYTDDCLGCVTPLDSTDTPGAVLYLVGVFNGAYGTLAHEIGHLTLFILDRAGVPVDAHHSEAFCYLQGHLFEVCQPFLDDANLKLAEQELAAAAEKGEEPSAKTAALVDALKGPTSPSKRRSRKGGAHGRR